MTNYHLMKIWGYKITYYGDMAYGVKREVDQRFFCNNLCNIWGCSKKCGTSPATCGYLHSFEVHPLFKPAHVGSMEHVPLNFLVSNFSIWGGYHKSSLSLSCFHPQQNTPGPPPLLVQRQSPGAMARVFINPGATEAKTKQGSITKYHMDMGQGVKMRKNVFLQQFIYLCVSVFVRVFFSFYVFMYFRIDVCI